MNLRSSDFARRTSIALGVSLGVFCVHPQVHASRASPSLVAEPSTRSGDPKQDLSAEEGALAVQRLHAEGEAYFVAREFGKARDAWSEAYALVPLDDSTLAYRTTLLSLITSATMEAYAVEGELERMREAVDMLTSFVSSNPGLDTELQQIVTDELRRLRPVVDRATPDEKTPLAKKESLDPDPVERPRRRLPIALVASGVVAVVGGAAAIVVGTRFRPRAERQQQSVDAPEAIEQAFLEDELRKGRGWLGAGVAIAVLGSGLTVAGAILLGRRRTQDKRARVVLEPGLRRWTAGVAVRF